MKNKAAGTTKSRNMNSDTSQKIVHNQKEVESYTEKNMKNI